MCNLLLYINLKTKHRDFVWRELQIVDRVIEIPAQKQFQNISSLSGFDKKVFNCKIVARKVLYVFRTKISKLLHSFKSCEHFNFRARPVINRVKIGHIYQHSHVSKSQYFFIWGSWVTFIGFFLLSRWYN